MNDSQNLIKKLKEQKKMLKTILANSPRTDKQKEAIKKAKDYLEKINTLLKSFGENNA